MKEEFKCVQQEHWKTYTLDSITLLLGHRDGLRTGRQRGVVVAIFTQQAQELVRVLRNEKCQLGVAGAELLQDRLQHLRLLLNDLAQLLELRVVAEKVEVAKSLACACACSCRRSRCRRCSTTTRAGRAAGTATSLLRSQVEQVNTVVAIVVVVIGTLGRGSSNGGSSGGVVGGVTGRCTSCCCCCCCCRGGLRLL